MEFQSQRTQESHYLESLVMQAVYTVVYHSLLSISLTWPHTSVVLHSLLSWDLLLVLLPPSTPSTSICLNTATSQTARLYIVCHTHQVSRPRVLSQVKVMSQLLYIGGILSFFIILIIGVSTLGFIILIIQNRNLKFKLAKLYAHHCLHHLTHILKWFLSPQGSERGR